MHLGMGFICLGATTLIRAIVLSLVLASTPVTTAQAWTQHGVASWYGPHFAGRKMSDGHTYHPNYAICAHRTLPLHTTIRVTDIASHRSTTCEVDDRGPYAKHRVLDMSTGVARVLGVTKKGITQVRIDVLSEPVEVAEMPEGHRKHRR